MLAFYKTDFQVTDSTITSLLLSGTRRPVAFDLPDTQSITHTTSILLSAIQSTVIIVQFKPTVRFEEVKDHRRNTCLMIESYAELDNGWLHRLLRERGYGFRSNVSGPTLVRKLGRSLRGLLDSEKCEVDVLRSICDARGMMSKARTVSGLARGLEHAEDELTFPDSNSGV
jgi:hypothetical protein